MTDRADADSRPAAPAPWAPPGAAPFGVPAPPSASTTGPAQHGPLLGYAPPAGYTAPPGFVPGAGYATGQRGPVPAASGFVSAGAPARTATLGITALVLALVATGGAAIAGSVAAFSVGRGTGDQLSTRWFGGEFDWSILTPVRDWVLLGEAAFWIGTIVGIAALVLGTVGVVTRRGRGPAIAAIAIAAVGPVVFGIVVQIFLTAGLSAGG